MSQDDVDVKISNEGKRLLLNRVARIVRLIRMDAPAVILANEARLIGDTEIMLDPDGYVERRVSPIKCGLGMCASRGCSADVDDDLGVEMCTGHSQDAVSALGCDLGDVS